MSACDLRRGTGVARPDRIMSANHDFTMPLDLLEALDEPTLPLVLVDSLDVARAPGGSAQVASAATAETDAERTADRGRAQPAVIIAANNGAPFVAGGRLVLTSPPAPPPRRVARGTEPVRLVAARPTLPRTR
jgi:hypothetical protein